MKTSNEQFNFMGEQELLNQTKTVFFCPYDVNDEVFSHIREWVASLDPMHGVIVCGNCTGVERFTLRLLLNKGFAVILPLATTIPENLEELNLGWKLSNEESTGMLCKAFDEHRLLLVSSNENVSVSVPTRKTLSIRCEWMREVGDRFVLACYREFSYFDHLLLGKPFSALLTEEQIQTTVNSEASDVEAIAVARKQEAIKMGWEIYRTIKNPEEISSSEQLTSLMVRYLQLNIEHPSLLHSLVLMAITKNYAEMEGFDFQGFVRAWSLQNLRPDDWKGFKSQSGQYLPSLAERCLSRMFRQMPSRNMMSLDYGRPFDTQLAHQWIEAALQHSPKNQRHVKKALRLAYYEHDREKIEYYKQLLAV